MNYDVKRHAAISGPFKFMKVIPDAVYFNTPDGSNQIVIHMDEKYHNAKGSDVLARFRNEVLGRGRKASPDELIKAAKAYVDQFSSVKHSDDDDDPDILTDDDVEIIEAPYPENGKAQIPRRSFVYDDEDGYPQDYFEHHGILGMKWGVRRYQNADGSLTDAGRKHYGVKRIKQESSAIKDPVDKQKYLMLEKQKATDKGTVHMSAAVAGGAGLATGALTKAMVAQAFASGASSVYVPVLGLAMATPVGQIASIAALTAGTAGTIYSIYRDKKINQLITENVAEASKQPLKVETVNDKKPSNNGMYVMAKPGELPESTRVTGKEEEEFWKALAEQYEEEEKKKK